MYATAALLDSTLPPVRRMLDRLLDAHLLFEPAAGRYRFHDLTRAHAANTAARDQTQSTRHMALNRLLDYYRHTAALAVDTAYPYERERRPEVPPASTPGPDLRDPTAALGWLDDELLDLLAAARYTAEHGWSRQHVVHLSTILHWHLHSRGRYHDAETLHHQALATARATGQPAGEMDALTRLGHIHRLQDRHMRQETQRDAPHRLRRARASSGSTTTSARSRCRTCCTSASPTGSSSRSGTRTTSPSVQVTMAETLDVAGRGAFYDGVGAIRDVVQNHVLQTVSILAMEPPSGHTAEALRNEKFKLPRLRPPTPPGGGRPGPVRGAIAGSQGSPGTPTWRPTSLCVCASTPGGGVGCRSSSARGSACRSARRRSSVELKRPPFDVFPERRPATANHLRFRLTPDMSISLVARAKKPGERMDGEEVELLAHHEVGTEVPPYQRLIGDAAEGDQTLFAREDTVEASTGGSLTPS